LNLRRSLRTGAVAGSNPWSGHTLEWSIPSPPPAYDFEQIPRITEDGIIHFSGPSSAHIPNGHSHTTMSHLSQWPLIIAAAAFVFLFGAVFHIAVPSFTNPILSILGLVISNLILLVCVALGIYSLYGYDMVRFVTVEGPVAGCVSYTRVSGFMLGVLE